MKPIKFEFVPPSPLPASPLPEKTVITLLKLKAFVLAEPRRYDQSTFMNVKKRGKPNTAIEFAKPPCGTICCLAGSAVLMEGYVSSRESLMNVKLPGTRKYRDLEDAAQEILGLGNYECHRLFAGDPGGNWCLAASQAFREAERLLYDLSDNDEDPYPAFQARAEAAAMELDHLIATGRVVEYMLPEMYDRAEVEAERADQDQGEDSRDE